MYFDGSLMKKGTRVGLVFVTPLGVHMRYVICIHFLVSNNVVEYEALINGLRITIELGIRWLDVQGDSQLVIDQGMKESSSTMPRWLRIVMRFDSWRTSSMASSSTISRGGSTKLQIC